MGDVVNLNKVRKGQAKAEAKKRAAANRVKHGRTGAEKASDRLAQDRLKQAVDQAKRDD